MSKIDLDNLPFNTGDPSKQMTLEDVCREYPEQVAKAIRKHAEECHSISNLCPHCNNPIDMSKWTGGPL